MNKTKTSKTRFLALSSILVALGVILLYVGSVITVLDLTMIAVASIIIYLSVIEMRSFYPYLIYGATAFLSLLLLPDKFAAVFYLLFGGLYPIVKSALEQIVNPILRWVVKLSYFNTSLLFLITIVVYVLHTEDSSLGFTFFVFLLGNTAFVLYDIAMTRLINLYIVKLRRVFGLSDYFEQFDR